MRSNGLLSRIWPCTPRHRKAGAIAVLIGMLVGLALTAAPALALPEGRTYEMVTPPYKGGYGVLHIEGVATNGESVAYYSPGVFAGSEAGLTPNIDSLAYLARREPSGWTTTPLLPPDSLTPVPSRHDIAPSLDTELTLGVVGSSYEAGNLEGFENDVWLHATDTADISPNWEIAGMPLVGLTGAKMQLSYVSATPDFCHILITPEYAGEPALLEKAIGVVIPLYELNRGCDGESPSLQLVALDNNERPISPQCGADLGALPPNQSSLELSIPESAFNAVSAGGDEIFFTTTTKPLCDVYGVGPILHHSLFVRLAGVRTLEISKPLAEACSEVPCPGAATRAAANFAGASEDGSTVFFTTAAPLVEEDKDTGNDLYMATIGCAPSEPECESADKQVTSLVQVSHEPIGGEADVQGVVRVAPDGSHVYFVARGDLLSEAKLQVLEKEGRSMPQTGADNLYVYDRELKEIAFIGDLCSGHYLSGTVEDVRCPSESGSDAELWGADPEAQTAGADGRFLVFSTYAQLTADDTDAAADVYRYDAQTEALERVSIGEAGYDSNGNNDAFNATIAKAHSGGYVAFQYELDNRAISEDGSRIVFKTAGPLSPAAINHVSNVYEWHKEPNSSGGKVSLVSSGSGEPVEDAVIDPSGRDIFFITSQSLVPQDTDAASDIYDARLEGGFPPVPEQTRECSADACQGPLTNPAPLLVPGSVSQAPGENLPLPASPTSKVPGKCPKAKKLSRGKCVKAKIKHRKTGAKKAHGADNRRGDR